MDFRNGQELLMKCHEESLPISDIMKLREMTNTNQSSDLIQTKLETVLRIMESSARKPIAKPGKSIGGLIGGEARMVSNHARDGKSICGTMLSKAISYSLAVLETNASMGLIVAAPTAGSSGVLPGTLLAAKEALELTKDLIPGIVKLKIDSTIKGELQDIEEEISIISEFTPEDDGGFIVTCKIIEHNKTIFEVSVSAASREQAKAISDNWKENAVDIS